MGLFSFLGKKAYAGGSYADHLIAVEAAVRELSLAPAPPIPTYRRLKAVNLGNFSRGGMSLLASGRVAGRSLEIMAVLAGGSFLTRLESPGGFSIELEALPSAGDHRLLGILKGWRQEPVYVDIPSLKAKVRSGQGRWPPPRDHSLWAELAELLSMSPAVFNYSSQVRPYFAQKLVVAPGRAWLHDYGLVCDKAYLCSLARGFAAFLDQWQRATERV